MKPFNIASRSWLTLVWRVTTKNKERGLAPKRAIQGARPGQQVRQVPELGSSTMVALVIARMHAQPCLCPLSTTKFAGAGKGTNSVLR